MKDGDLDTLEQILPSVAHGNLRKYSLIEIAPQSLRRLCELSQLAVQYLLYVQDRLAADVQGVKVREGNYWPKRTVKLYSIPILILFICLGTGSARGCFS